MSSAFTIENKFSLSWIQLLIVCLIAKAFVCFLLLSQLEVGLAPDEAQYWTWSQHLDWGYYSKPPAIAWQIWLTTLFFGDSEIGVRFGAVLLNFFLPLTIFAGARYAELSPRAAFWSALVCAFSPLGIFLAFMATTDGGAVLFFTLAIVTVLKGIQDDEGPNYIQVGAWILLGGLYKWVVFLFWPITLIGALFIPTLRKKSLIGGLLISFLAFLPAIYWNMHHDWATFKHVGATITAQNKGGNFFSFFGAQLGLFNPVFWGLSVASIFYLRRPSLIYLALFLGALLFYILLSLGKHMQPNWALFLYPSLSILAAWYALAKLKWGGVWLHIGVWSSIIFSLFAMSIPFLENQSYFTRIQIPFQINPFRQNLGWNQLSQALSKHGYLPDKHFLFSDKYQNTSLLSFYGPEKKQAYFLNLANRRRNQFSYWPGVEEQVGKSGFFLVLENHCFKAQDWYQEHYVSRLAPFFENVQFLGTEPLFRAYGKPVKCAFIFFCKNYNGKSPFEKAHF